MKTKILFILCILFGLMMINAGLNKFFNYMPTPEDLPESMKNLMAAAMQINWLMPLVAIVEIVGGILFFSPKCRTIGALIILPVMVGIVLTNIFSAPEGLPIALIFFAINLWVLYEDRGKLYPLFCDKK